MERGQQEFDLADQKATARFFAIAALATGAVAALLLVLRVVVAGYLFLALCVALFGRSLFNVITVVVQKVTSKHRVLVQALIAIAAPLPMGAFLLGSEHITSETVYHLVSWYGLLMVSIVAYISWAAGHMLSRTVPVRGFLIGAASMFVIMLVGKGGGLQGFDELGYPDIPETPDAPMPPAMHALRYAIYVATIYVFLLLGFLHEKRRSKKIFRT
jgi:hypothetical protein